MDQTKITKLLRLMKLLTGNVSRTIDQLAAEMGITSRTIYRYIDTIREAGFVVNKLYGNVYAMGKVGRGLSDFNKLIYFTEEAKDEIYKKFNHSLVMGGMLFIGSTEQIMNYRDIGYGRKQSFFFVKESEAK